MRSQPALRGSALLLILCSHAYACDEGGGAADASLGTDATVSTPMDGGGQQDGGGGTGPTTGAGGSGGAFGGTGGFGGAAGVGGFGGSSGVFSPPPMMCSSCVCAGCMNCINCGSGCFCQDMTMGAPPQPLPWDPPFNAIGDVGYKNSTTPLCSGIDTLSALAVWSDSRGVFALVSGSGVSRSALSPEDDAGVVDIGDMGPIMNQNLPRTQIWQNDGTAWALRVDAPNIASGLELSGMPGGPLIVNDPTSLQAVPGMFMPPPVLGMRACPLGTSNGNGDLTCQDLDPVQGVADVDRQLAYALTGGTRLLEFNGVTWHGNTALLPYPATGLWADHDDIVAVGKAGTVLWYGANTWTLDDPGTIESFTSVWGTSRNDVYAGSSSGAVFHYDGMAWKQIGKLGGTSCKTQLPVTGIWGAGSSVFFHSDAQLARWNGTKLESLGNWTCAANINGPIRISGMWGNSATELFLGIIDPSRGFSDLCGGSFIVRYDGKKFHRM